METQRRRNIFLLSLLLSAVAVESIWPEDLLDSIFGGFNPSDDVAPAEDPDYDTDYGGKWEMLAKDAGVSAMHLILMPSNKVIMFDSTIFQPSARQLQQGNCRPSLDKNNNTYEDCWVHAVEFDPLTAQRRSLKVLTDTWCSSGGLDVGGNLVQTGGYKKGERAIRYLASCPDCDWREYPEGLAAGRWYGTQVKLADGSFIVVGGRGQFNYEFVPTEEGQSSPKTYALPLLQETNDPVENNLYPFVYLAPDGNIFIFANNRAILLDWKAGKTVREFPVLNGGARNYPSSGMSALLPIEVRNDGQVVAEVIVCGGGPPDAFSQAQKGIFTPALQSCGRISITDPKSKWQMENMPTPRTMGDMVNLPNGDLLIVNGVKSGSAGWWFGRDPILNPVIYRPTLAPGQRFRTLAATTIPRVYHSTAAVLADGSVIISGSNTNDKYNYRAQFPTLLSVEKFYPPYFDQALDAHRPTLLSATFSIGYGQTLSLQFSLPETEDIPETSDVKVTMYSPPFTTHGYSMNQRLLVMQPEDVSPVLGPGTYRGDVTTPDDAALAPPGYYLFFVVNRGVPSNGIWIQISD